MQVHGHQNGKPEHVNAQGFGYRRQDGHDDEGNLHEVDEETKNQDDQHGQNDEAPLLARQHQQPFLQQIVAAGVTEHHGEGRGSNQNGEDHRSNADRVLRRIPDHLERELTVDQRQYHRADTAQS